MPSHWGHRERVTREPKHSRVFLGRRLVPVLLWGNIVIISPTCWVESERTCDVIWNMGLLIPVFKCDLRAPFVIETCRNGQNNPIDFNIPDRFHLQALLSTAPGLRRCWEGQCWGEEGFPEAPPGVREIFQNV